jgi:hypothetical protein
VPAAQLTQEAGALANVPEGQEAAVKAHVDAPAVLYAPAGQLVQEDAPAALNAPAGQG